PAAATPHRNPAGRPATPPWKSTNTAARRASRRLMPLARPLELLHGHVDRLDLDVAHAGEGGCDPLLHGGRHLGEYTPVRDGELQLAAGAAVLQLDTEPPASLAQPRTVDRGDSAPHDLRQRGLAHADGAAALLHEHPAHDPASAGSRAPASSRNDVEYSPLRNSSLSRISARTSCVVGTPSSSSSHSARRAR